MSSCLEYSGFKHPKTAQSLFRCNIGRFPPPEQMGQGSLGPHSKNKALRRSDSLVSQARAELTLELKHANAVKVMTGCINRARDSVGKAVPDLSTL